MSVASATATPVDAAALQRVFDIQAATALRLRASTADERLARIRRLRDALLDQREAIYNAGQLDFRKPAAEMDLTELLPVLTEANTALRQLHRWMRPQHVGSSLAMLGTQAQVQYQPKGRCLIIAPWNYPVNLSLGPLVSALAAGNTVVLKPSELTPHLSGLIARLLREIFPEDEVAVFEGDAAVSAALLALPFDHIFFTGSPQVGRLVMAAAARHLSSVTLELGGKSPTVVDETADLPAAARAICWGKFTNDGQTCVAPDHVWVHEAVKDEFLDQCRGVLERAYGDDSGKQLESPHLARIVNARHTARLAGLLEDARSRGAEVVAGGVVRQDHCYIAPTLLSKVPPDAAIMDQEIFGPLLPVLRFGELDEVINAINAQPKALALYIWSRNERSIQRLVRQTSSGGVCINATVMQFGHAKLPFGGVNHSGLGNAHGWYGFKAFSHERAVLRDRYSLIGLFFPPYTAWTRRLLRILLRLV